MSRWLGIDFSGDDKKWRPRCLRSNVWVADVRMARSRLTLHSLGRVHTISTDTIGSLFFRLVRTLASEEYLAAAIDAPFSVPANFLPAGGHADLLALTGSLPRGYRSFCTGAALVHAVAGQSPPLNPPKPLRKTEQVWAKQRVNVRSTMWVNPRGGAPMTAACLTLLFEVARPIWPWRDSDTGLLVEAFPAAQLFHWGRRCGDYSLPFEGYNGNRPEAHKARDRIVDVLSERIDLGSYQGEMRANADAIDAVLCAFAAIAVTENRLGVVQPDDHKEEGWIAVHS